MGPGHHVLLCLLENVNEIYSSFSFSARICTTVTRQKLKQQDRSQSEESQPYPFISNFRQNKHRVEETFIAQGNSWKYQPFVILTCTGVFLFYFLVWREEHSVDFAIRAYMYETRPDLEVEDLKRTIQKVKKRGQDTRPYEDRLNELLTPKSQ